MRMIDRAWVAASVLLLAGCAAVPAAPTDEIRNALAPTGKLRVGVYPGSPTSMLRDAASGETRGVSVDLGRELAMRLAVPYEPIEYQRIAQVLEGMTTRQVDFTVTNATPARAKQVDFTQPVLALELGFLVAAGSSLSAVGDLKRAGIRVGVTSGSTSETSLPNVLPGAVIIAVPALKTGVDMLAQGKLDAFATNKAILYEMSGAVPGSRVLDGRWGVERFAVAVPKGRDTAMRWLRGFVDDARARGLVRRAIERAGLRGSIDESAER
jgi:polar amino acid transport system substrate-binding protein